MERIQGSLTAYGQLDGNLIAVNVIRTDLGGSVASMGGILTPIETIFASLASSAFMSAELTLPKGKASPAYQGEYVVTPKAETETVLQTNGFKMLDDVTVLQIPYYETHGTHGTTVYIANEV